MTPFSLQPVKTKLLLDDFEIKTMDLDVEKVDKLKVVELRTALGEAGLDTKGTKPVLVARLKEHLEAQKAAPAEEAAEEAEPEAKEEDAKPADERK